MGPTAARSPWRGRAATSVGVGRALVVALAVLSLGSVLATAAPPAAFDHGTHDPGTPGHGTNDHEMGAIGAAGEHALEDPTGAHGDSEGLKLVPARAETVTPGGSCDAAAPRRTYDVAAITVDLTLNRYLDHDPDGRMYALLDQVEEVRAEEAANELARATGSEPAVTSGQQGDVIQPLTLRVLPGDCLVIALENQLPDEPASLHLHGSSLRVSSSAEPAVATEPSSLAGPGEQVVYEWMVPKDEPEATHYFHSHGDERAQTNHGLFGAVVVEPPGSSWTDPLTGAPTETGWQVVITSPDQGAFREFALYYHEIGDEKEQLRNGKDRLIPLVDPVTSAYRPATRALNYRSEPFMNRLLLQQEMGAQPDESLEYSSYTFGDPATPLPRSYVGDPVKQRVVHGGSEVFHVHHVHGGTVRWPRQPGAPGTDFAASLDKQLPMTPVSSERTDSQTLGPSETFDVEPECVAGGCQLGAGDFMYHCHVGHHYFAGMWGINRVYNTLQDGLASTDDLPVLLPLPNRQDAVVPAVTSDRLVGTGIELAGQTIEVTGETVGQVVARLLPPPGVPALGDASVFDWIADPTTPGRYLGEPETAAVWPGYASSTPGERPVLLFDAKTGRLAHPFLRPHLGKRPPFAPGHGPAPYLDPTGNGRDPPSPGASGASSLCPEGTRQRQFAINAVRAPVWLNQEQNLLDSNGMLFVLRSQRDQVIDDPSLQVPLALRTNAGEDCVDVLLRSELRSDRLTPFSKVGLHIHFVQFDVQASDGVDVGFNYEQTIRPYREAGTTIATAAANGSTTLRVADAASLRPGSLIGVGMDLDEGFEVAQVAAITGEVVALADPLRHDHLAGEWVSTEFVRYRWFPDVQFGTAYFHDHVDALTTWQHGLFGALVAEPPGATWTDPATGEPLASGPIADVHTDQPIGVDVRGSFRELLLFTQDDNRITHVRRSSGSSFNLRVEPLADRVGPPELLFNSDLHGDPETPILRAHLGDPLVIRDLVGGANEIHTLHVDGHWFRHEAWSPTSPPVASVDVGISERYDLVVPAAGGPQRLPGDYLYENGRHVKLEEGSWGLIRVLPAEDDSIVPLPDRQASRPAAEVCPADAPVRSFEVSAVEVPGPMLGRNDALAFVTTDLAVAVAAGTVQVEPLVLRASVGDCLLVALTNQLVAGNVSFRTDLLGRDPASSAGIAAGREPDQSVAPDGTRTYQLYASPEVGETAVLVRDGASVLDHVGRGLYGAIIIAGEGAAFLDPATGEELGSRSSWQADVVPARGSAYRDAVLLFHDEDESLGTHHMPYTENVDGAVAVNYRAERLGSRSIMEVVQSGGPVTPVIEAVAGDPVRIHVLAPWSEQAQVFSLEGHTWPQEPGLDGTVRLSSRRIGGLQAMTLHLDSAGGPDRLPGDYLWGNHRLAYQEAGAWGLLRVRAPAQEAAGPRALPPSTTSTTLPLGIAVGLAMIGSLWFLARRSTETVAVR